MGIGSSQLGLQLRLISYRLFSQVIHSKKFIKDVILTPSYAALSQENKSFVRNLISTSFRKYLKINFILDQYVDYRIDAKIRYILTLASAEVMCFNTPNYAVVNTYVNLAKELGFSKFAGLVNAVVKRIINNYSDLLLNYKLDTKNWLVSLLIKDYGYDVTFNILEYLGNPPKLDLFVIDNDLSFSDSNSFLPGHVQLNKVQPIINLRGFQEGGFWVQGMSSIIAIHGVRELIKGNIVADLCSAPGGKTLLINYLGANKIRSVDISESRLKQLEDNLARVNLDTSNIEIIKSDILQLNSQYLQDCKLIVLDSPCMSSGTLNKNPEILVTKSLKDINDLVLLQSRLMNHIVDIMPKGSYLLYCNCSLHKLEGEALIDQIVNDGHVKLVELPNYDYLKPYDYYHDTQYCRIIPRETINAGFFICLLQKVI